MKANNVLKKKSFEFALRIVNLYRYLKSRQHEYIISKQVMRAGTAIGAMLREAEFAESRRDFTHKLSIGLKELNETVYWLELLFAAKYINEKMFDSMFSDAESMIKLFVSSINTLKSSNANTR